MATYKRIAVYQSGFAPENFVKKWRLQLVTVLCLAVTSNLQAAPIAFAPAGTSLVLQIQRGLRDPIPHKQGSYDLTSDDPVRAGRAWPLRNAAKTRPPSKSAK